MTTLDLTPLYRSTIGFERLSDLLADATHKPDAGFSPYNIEKLGDDAYRIVMAVAGFSADDIEIVAAQNRLSVRGKAKEKESAEYLYRGIAARTFERSFDLAEYVEVVGANLENGLLEISLKRELPERLKPRRIELGGCNRPRPASKKLTRVAA